LIRRAKVFQQQKDWENAIQDYLTVLSNPEHDQKADTQIKAQIGEIYYHLAKSKYEK
jgi:hypothetical protein